MKATVVPNRNKIFASITQAVALSIADKTGEQCDIAMGIHAGDHAIYPDCRQEFKKNAAPVVASNGNSFSDFMENIRSKQVMEVIQYFQP